MIETIYRYRGQRFSPHEHAIVVLAVEAKYTDHRIAKWLGRTANGVKRHRRIHGLWKQRGRGLWFVLAVATAAHAQAAPPEHVDPGLSSWFQSLMRPDGMGPCCSMFQDCRPAEYRLAPSGDPDGSDYEALIDGQWMRVPRRALLTRHDNPTGRGILCKQSAGTFIFCFVPADEF